MSETKLRWRVGNFEEPYQRDSAVANTTDEWGNLLHLGWATLDSDLIQLRGGTMTSMRENKSAHAAALWTLAIQLMVTGLGWTDIRAGLRGMKASGNYLSDRDPIINFLRRNFGEAIFALESYMIMQPRTELNEAILIVAEVGRNVVANQIGITLPKSSIPEPTAYEMEMAQLEIQNKWMHFSGENAWLVRALFEGGTDPLHLEPHNAALLNPEVGQSWMGVSGPDLVVSHKRVRTIRYECLAQEIPRWLGILSKWELGQEQTESLEFRIGGWPSFGFFNLNFSTGRAYRLGSEEAHLWGNPI